MKLCPRSAKHFGHESITETLAAEWCRSQYVAHSERCSRCKYAQKYNKETVKPDKQHQQPEGEQLRLF